MKSDPRFEKIFATLSAASIGDLSARVEIPADPDIDDAAVKLGIAINLLLDDLAFRSAEAEASRKISQAELERLVRERTEQLRQSEEKFSKAFRSSPSGISIATLADGRWIEVNEALQEMTGYRKEEMIGRTSVELGLVDDAARAKIMQAIREHGSVRNVGIQLITKTREYVDVLVSVEQIELDGQACSLSIQHDVSPLMRAEREVRRLNATLEQGRIALEAANKELEAFSYSVAHDLRAPLRSIVGFSNLVVEDNAGRLDEQGRKYLGQVCDSARQMGLLIDDLLMLSRVTKSELQRATVDLSACARSGLERLARLDPGRKAELIIPDGISADCDARLIGILFENLLGNAWKFTAKAPVTRIEFGAFAKDGSSVYFVRDNGAGFDMRYAGKLFGVFQRLHAVSEYEGTGIGLATVQRIVHRHGGRVWGEGRVGLGATFYFTLGGTPP
jgi:PAS domain S-box-containing protein